MAGGGGGVMGGVWGRPEAVIFNGFWGHPGLQGSPWEAAPVGFPLTLIRLSGV